MNAIGADTLEMLQAGVTAAAENFQALVIGNDAPHFSAGANLMLLLLEAQEGNWDQIDIMIRTFQATTQALRYADVPVVSCPAGMTLGGGCEIVLYGDRVQSAAEAYIGLVEAGVGLIPAAGGTTEMLARAVHGMRRSRPRRISCRRSSRCSKRSAWRSFHERRGWAEAGISAARRRHIDESRAGRRRREEGGRARSAFARATGSRCPGPSRWAATVCSPRSLGVHLAWRSGRITDHDAVVGRALASSAGGGSAASGDGERTVLLELEREAFLRLCGEQKRSHVCSAHVEDRQAATQLRAVKNTTFHRGALQRSPRIPAIRFGPRRSRRLA